ncbi:molybdenum cofactor guanylyltransferase MobA [Palleronia caenipelagi]|uniref:Molybdenum cofactor guanylyltransferase n=1 Tax=Palleronia caenipelagi TaxID=2489174 RepID=A0A547Q2W6_9RHOB|nr:molybdenum cofactor guanylyltransferase MobA [Palleronia caenipelagi]TRD20713.1 molybdenum cofactor guanylyltransferase MobA [Palleronia caenipelagi]
MIAPVGVILAGGRATRMGGGDKGRLMLGNRSILDRVTERFAPQVADLALSANGDPARFADLRLTVLPDPVEGHPGPLAGVLAGLDWAAHRCATHLVTAAADTPFLPPDLVPQLLWAAERDGQPIALAATRDPESGRLFRHPTFGLWPVELRDDLRAALLEGVRKVVLWTDRHGTALAEFPTTPFDPFFNLNRPEDLAQAEDFLCTSTG